VAGVFAFGPNHVLDVAAVRHSGGRLLEDSSVQRTKLTGLMGFGSIVCGLALVGCGGGAQPTEAKTAGGETTKYEGPIASTDSAHGKELFGTFCDDCHPNGESDVGPSLIETPHTPARIRQQIREGGNKMPPFSEKKLSNDDVEAVLAYLATLNAVK
jgi:mono/diheme cytochrome c family protein